MKAFIPTLVMLLWVTACAVQKESAPMQGNVGITRSENRMPEPIGGMDGIYRSIRYPSECRLGNVEGRVVVQFIVEADGRTRDHVVIKGIHSDCDREALRAVRLAKWTPGYMNGQPVVMQMQVPIVFRLR